MKIADKRIKQEPDGLSCILVLEDGRELTVTPPTWVKVEAGDELPSECALAERWRR